MVATSAAATAPTDATRNLRIVDLLDAPDMSAALERRLQPRFHDRHHVGFGNHALAKREHVRIIVGAAEPRGLDVPADRGAHAGDAVGDDRLAVAGAPEDDAALEFAPGHGLRRRANE